MARSEWLGRARSEGSSFPANLTAFSYSTEQNNAPNDKFLEEKNQFCQFNAPNHQRWSTFFNLIFDMNFSCISSLQQASAEQNEVLSLHLFFLFFRAMSWNLSKRLIRGVEWQRGDKRLPCDCVLPFAQCWLHSQGSKGAAFIGCDEATVKPEY